MRRSVQEILAEVHRLPAVPGVVQQVLSLVSDPDFSYEELMETVRLDPGITAGVLRVCNSPYYGLRQKVNSLKHALTLLGPTKVVDIVLSNEVVGFYKETQEGYNLARGELWRHSMATALLAQKLGRKTGYRHPSMLFTAALLHDVGKLILSEYVGEDFDQIEEVMSRKKISFVEAEREVLGLDHALLGGAVARVWYFPEPIVKAIALHHDPGRARTDADLVRLVAVANLLVISMGVGVGAEGLSAPVDPGLLKSVGLKSKDLQDMTLEIKSILDQAEELLDLAR